MKKALIILLIIAVLAGGTVAALYFTGVIGGGGDDTPATCVDGHTWTVESKTEAKCYKKGSQVLLCSVCGETMEQELPMTAHKIAMISAKEATCTKAGNTAGEKCMNAGCSYATGNETIPMTGHVPVDTPAKAASCTEMGYSEGGQHCKVCSVIIVEPTETYPKLSHTYVDAGRIEPTCASEGSVGGTRCKDCGQIGVAPDEILDKLEEHSAPFVVKSHATCTTDGYLMCPVCGYEEIFEYRDTSLHNFTKLVSNKVEPNCVLETDGITAEWQCSNPECETTVGGNVIEWESCHDDDKLVWNITIEATTEHAGEKVGVCELCGTSFRQDIPQITNGDFNEDNDIYPDDIIGNGKEEDETTGGKETTE